MKIADYRQWQALGENAHFQPAELARLSGCSLRQLERHFQGWFARSPEDWLNEQRMMKAQRLLLELTAVERERPRSLKFSVQVKKLAYDLGFKHPAHFCHQFKKTYGLSACEFLAQHRRMNSIGCLLQQPIPEGRGNDGWS